MATIGMLLTALGAALLWATLGALRGEVCPVCGLAGELAEVGRTTVEEAGLGATYEVRRRCEACGITVRETKSFEAARERDRLARRLLTLTTR